MRLGARSYRPRCLLDHAGRLVPVQCCQAATLLAELVSFYCASQVQSLLSILASYWRRVACTCNSVEGYASDNIRRALSGNGAEEGYDAPCRISGAFLKEDPQGVFFTFPSCTAFHCEHALPCMPSRTCTASNCNHKDRRHDTSCTCAFCISRANSCSYVLLDCTETDAALMIFPSAAQVRAQVHGLTASRCTLNDQHRKRTVRSARS
jgi:hypothetical protein